MSQNTELNAEIEYARVSLRLQGTKDIPAKVGCDEVVFRPDEPIDTILELPILNFDERLLHVDGFLAGSVLKYIRRTRNELWFIFGTFRTVNGKRCYVTLPARQVPELLLIHDWRILEWTGRKIHRV